MLSKVYINLLDQKEPKLNFNKLIKSNKNEKNQIISEYSKKIISLTSEEFKKHKEYIKKNLKKNFF